MTAPQTARLYERVRAAILSLELAPGERLTERALEAAFSASRTPVRAALLRLGAEGLVVRGERGFTVAPIDAREIGQLAELREAIEVAAVRLAIARASASDIEALVELVQSDHGTTEVVTAGDAFHETLAGLSGNPLFTASVHAAMTRLARTRSLEGRTADGRELAWQEHRAIAAAVELRDEDLAATLMARHIRDTNHRLLQVLAAEHGRFRAHGVLIET